MLHDKHLLGYQGHKVDVIYINLLRTCARKKDVNRGIELHNDILRKGLLASAHDHSVACSLLSMYVHCGALDRAQLLLSKVTIENVVSWNELIAGYAKLGKGKDALKCFEEMQRKGITPDAITFICLLKACVSLLATDKGREIHDEIVGTGLLDRHVELGNALVDMYAKCGEMKNAQQVFNELPLRNVVTWSVLIAGYAKQGMGQDALNCFKQMEDQGISPDVRIFASILKACAITGEISKGKVIHDHLICRKLLEGNVVLGTALVDMYARCGALVKAQQLFQEMHARTVVSWNALLTAYAQQRLCKDAFQCFNEMQCDGVFPDTITLTTILKICGIARCIDKGKQIHSGIIHQGASENNIMLGTSLVDMYAKCGALSEAQRVLEKIPIRNETSWNALIAGYAHRGLGEEALNCFKWMQQEGISPDTITFSCMLKGCTSVRAFAKGEEMHDGIIANRQLGDNVLLATALVDMYVKSGFLVRAQRILDVLSVRDAAVWNALIAGYAKQGHTNSAFKLLERMRREGIIPDTVTFLHILKACGSSGDIDKGERIHGEIISGGLLEMSNELGNALVDMYAKCGIMEKAQKLLDKLSIRDTASWSALIAGYASQGQTEKAINCFEEMQHAGVIPNAVTFLSLLTACSHEGLIDEGQMYFASMTRTYGITPSPEHYACMVDLFGRAGHFKKAMAVINEMPSCDYLPIWSALLGACRMWGNIKLGWLAFRKAVQLDTDDPAAYVCMANIYAAAGMLEHAKGIQAMRVRLQLDLPITKMTCNIKSEFLNLQM